MLLHGAGARSPVISESAAGFVTTLERFYVQLTGLGAVYDLPIDLVLGDGHGATAGHPGQPKGNRAPPSATRRFTGLPDLVVEIASPSTARYDRDAHRGQAGGLRPRRHSRVLARLALMVKRSKCWSLADERSTSSAGVFHGDERLPSRVLPDLPVAVKEFFVADPR